MGSGSLSKDIAIYLVKNYDVQYSRRGHVRVGEFSLSGNGLAKKFYNFFVASDKEAFLAIDKDLVLKSESDAVRKLEPVMDSIRDYLMAHVKAVESKKFVEKSEIINSTDIFDNILPVVDIQSPIGSSVMVDKVSGHVVPFITERAWEKVVGKAAAIKMTELQYNGLFEYNPRSTKSSKPEATPVGEVIKYNKYVPPAWKVTQRDNELDTLFLEFFDTLFGTECRQYVIDWTWATVNTRVPVYLVMVGTGGIGKNLYAEALRQLHGQFNFKKAPATCLDTKFNGHLADCTILYYDECRFSSGEGRNTRKNKLKEWANEFVPVEKKGVDAADQEIYCSAIIATNNDSDVDFEQADRKFSVVELSTIRLEKRMGVKRAHQLWDYVLSDEFGGAFANWLEENASPNFESHIEYKGPRFNELVITSLYGWKQELREMIMAKEAPEYSCEGLRDRITNFPRQTAKINDFIKNFLEDGAPLGKIEVKQGIKFIIPADKFIPPEQEGMDMSHA